MELPKMNILKLEIIDGNIAVLTIDRPEKRNSLNTACHEDLRHFAEFLDNDNDMRVGIITSIDKKIFVSGNDISGFHTDTFFIPNSFKDAVDRLEACHKPIIMAINGMCIGGGTEMAMAGDIRIMSDNASMSMPEAGLGIVPGCGGIQRIARCAGTQLAKEMALTGRRVKADECYLRGLVTAVVPQDQLMDKALEFARMMTARAPLALSFIKHAANVALDVDIRDGFRMCEWAQLSLARTQDKEEGVKAFMEKRKPNFIGH